jgi:hypothetical protein
LVAVFRAPRADWVVALTQPWTRQARQLCQGVHQVVQAWIVVGAELVAEVVIGAAARSSQARWAAHKRVAGVYSLGQAQALGIAARAADIGAPALGIAARVADIGAQALADKSARAVVSERVGQAADHCCAAHTQYVVHYMVWSKARVGLGAAVLNRLGPVAGHCLGQCLATKARGAHPILTDGFAYLGAAPVGQRVVLETAADIVAQADKAMVPAAARDSRLGWPPSVVRTSSAPIAAAVRDAAAPRQGQVRSQAWAMTKTYTWPRPTLVAAHKSARHCQNSKMRTSDRLRTP